MIEVVTYVIVILHQEGQQSHPEHVTGHSFRVPDAAPDPSGSFEAEEGRNPEEEVDESANVLVPGPEVVQPLERHLGDLPDLDEGRIGLTEKELFGAIEQNFPNHIIHQKSSNNREDLFSTFLLR